MTTASRAANKSSGRSNSSKPTNGTRGLGKLSTSTPRNPARARAESKARARNNPR